MPTRPSWAHDVPPHPFKSHAPLLITPAYAIPLNTPFTGPYYTGPSTRLAQQPTHQQIALAVSARYDPPSQRIWIAVRKIWTSATEHERTTEVMWCVLERLEEMIQEWALTKPGFQVLGWKREVVDAQGRLDGVRILEAWMDDVGIAGREDEGMRAYMDLGVPFLL